jgi:Fe-S-cluster containining protein
MSNKRLPDLFPCSGCGACCRRINKGIKNIGMNNTDKDNLLYFPYK